MYCCVNCFDDDNIIKKVTSFEEEGDCEYCGSKDVLIADTSEIGEFIRDGLTKGYVNATIDELPYSVLGNFSTTIDDVLRNIECVFSDKLEEKNKVEELLNDLFADSGPSWHDIAQGDYDEWEGGNAEVVLKDIFYGVDYNSYKLNWDEFTYTVKHVNRFFDVGSSRSREIMLNEFDSFFDIMAIELPIGTQIWRARCEPEGECNTWEEKTKECGPPPRSKSMQMRMNPAGISYFYGAENKNTCYQEIRGSNCNKIVYGLFETRQILKILDLSKAPNIRVPSLFSTEYNHELNWAKDFLVSFCSEVSKPITDGVAPIEYVPTQILSEYIRMRGYNGVRYKSSLTDGYNYTLFCGPQEAESYKETWILRIEDLQIPVFTEWLKLIKFKEVK